jgi:hypothetical protein
MSGKVDLYENIIYVREYKSDNKFEINTEVKVSIKRESNNKSCTIRSNREFPN